MADCVRLEGRVEKVKFASTKGDGFQILSLKCKDGHERTVKGRLPVLHEGESIVLLAEEGHDPKFGRQFTVQEFVAYAYDTEAALISLFGSKRFKGVDKKLGKAAVKHFGVDVFKILDADPKRIAEVHGVGDVRAAKFIESYAEGRADMRIDESLIAMGLTPEIAVRARAHFGKDDVLAVVGADPYALTQVERVGFKTADQVALKGGMGPGDPRRVQAALLFAADDAQSQGHCYLEYFALVRTAEKLTSETVSQPAIGAQLRALVEDGRLIREGVNVYDVNLYHAERAVAQKLAAMLKQPARPVYDSGDDLRSDLARSGDLGGVTLSDNQVKGAMLAVASRVCVITGAAGTGKSTLQRAVCSLMDRCSLDLKLCAPTGRAAKRLAEATGRQASTIHMMLGYKGGKFFFNENNPLVTDVVLVDEASMLDIKLFRSLLDAMEPSDRLVLVGDVNQLPSVGAGNVLRDLILSKKVPVVTLDRVYRQSAGSFLLDAAHEVLAGRVPAIPAPRDMKGRNVAIVEVATADEVHDAVARIVTKVLPSKGFGPDDIQVISPMRKNGLGTEALNLTIQDALNPPCASKSEIAAVGCTLREGDRVINVKNNYRLGENGVFNGDIGRVEEVVESDESVFVTYPDMAEPIEYDSKVQGHLQLGYALTVHKCVSKGSMVSTPTRGLVEVERIASGDRVVTDRGFEGTVANAWCSGSKPQWRLRTRSGYECVASAEHPFLIGTEGGYSYRRLDEIQVGDFACVSRVVLGGAPFTPPAPYRNPGERIRALTAPSRMDEDGAWVLGALIGDGTYTQKNGTFQYGSTDVELADRVRSNLEGLGVHCSSRMRDRYHVVGCSNASFRRWLSDCGLGHTKGPSKRVPSWVFGVEPNVRAAFLRGLYDTDGSAASYEIKFTSASGGLARDVQTVLLTLGVVSSLKRRESAGKVWFDVLIHGSAYACFRDAVNFGLARKRAIVDKRTLGAGAHRERSDMLPQARTIGEAVRSTLRSAPGFNRKGRGLHSDLGMEGAGVHTNRSLRSGVVVRRAIHDGRLSVANARDLSEMLGRLGLGVPAVLREAVDRNYYHDPVVLVEPLEGECVMYDLEVAADHSFVADGFVVHNCQGAESPAVVLVLHSDHGHMLQRNLLYTAMTRARKLLAVVGTREAVAKAVANNNEIARNTTLGLRLGEALAKA